eukprot:751964-Hanusia_phi.AAC.2
MAIFFGGAVYWNLVSKESTSRWRHSTTFGVHDRRDGIPGDRDIRAALDLVQGSMSVVQGHSLKRSTRTDFVPYNQSWDRACPIIDESM